MGLPEFAKKMLPHPNHKAPSSSTSSTEIKLADVAETAEFDAWGLRKEYQSLPLPDNVSGMETAKTWIEGQKHGWTAKQKKWTALDWASEIVPCIGWLRTYKWISEGCLRDIVAGISIAGMLVPHGLAYSKSNGGLPAQYGLYNAFVTVLVYFAFGSCRTLSVGPIAILYALVKSGLQDVNPVYNKIKDNNKPIGAAQIRAQNEFNTMCIQVAFLVGIIQLIAWSLRLSFLLKFLSRSIMSGFTTAVAVIFSLSQLKSILGYPTTSSNRVYLQIYYLCKNIGQFKWKEFVFGVSMLILLFGMHNLSLRFPRRLKYVKVFAPLTAMVLSIIITASARLDKHGIKVVGAIPRGLPKPSFDRLFPMEHFSKVFTTAIIAACVSLLDQNAIGKAVAAKNNYRLNSHHEFRAMGLANLIGSFFTCTATSGNFSRTAVWTQIGGKTQLAGFIMAWIVALCLGVATAAFKYIPNNTLAAITIYGLWGLLEVGHLKFLWKVSKGDFIIWNAAFWVATMHSVEVGLAAGLGTSIAIYVLRTVFAPLRQEGKLTDSAGNTIFRNIGQYKIADVPSEVQVFRLDTNIFFASVEDLHDHIIDRIEALLAQGRPVLFVVLDLSSSPYIDPTGLHFLQDIFQNLAKRKVEFLLANPQQNFVQALDKAGLLNEERKQRLFVSVSDAVNFANEVIVRINQNVQLALKV